MPLRGGTTGSNPFQAACRKIRGVADRVYGEDSPRAQACKRMLDEMERLVSREDHTPNYNPYQVTADRLKTNWPEVWEGDERNSGKKALARWVP